MAHVVVDGSELVVSLDGADKLWAFRGHLAIPLSHVAGIRHDPDEVRATEWTGVKAYGARIPDRMAVGSFHQSGDWVFWDVHDPDRTVIVELHDEHYARLVVEVEDPEQVVEAVATALRSGSGSATPPAG
ncbi:MAG: hypothetical protein M0007_00655 [Actinomycetota bacterium]|jgi:hypothetical protein|nr:hypothetical protein [Actinomycetota bacterium]